MARYVAKPRTVDMIIDDKLDGLEDFTIVTDENRESIRNIFVKAIRDHSNSNVDTVVDNVAKTMIKEFVYH